MLMERSGEERLKMGCSMHATARALVIASISEKDPAAVKQTLFLRFYGHEFEPKRRKAVLRALRHAAELQMIKEMRVAEKSGAYRAKRTRAKRKQTPRKVRTG